MMKILASVAVMLLALGSFGCSDDDSGGSGPTPVVLECDYPEVAPEFITGLALVGTVVSGTGELCDTPGTVVDAGFYADTEPGAPPNFGWRQTTNEVGTKPDCNSYHTGTYSYSTDGGALGTLEGTTSDGDDIVLQICIQDIIEDGATSIYSGNYEFWTEDGDTATGTIDAMQPHE